MSKYGPVKKGDKIVLHHVGTNDVVAAIARQDWEFRAGSLAHFTAWIEQHDKFPGIESLMVNTNIWNVYPLNDPDLALIFGENPVHHSRYETIYGPVFYSMDKDPVIFSSNN